MRVSKTGPKPEYSTPRKIEDKINAFFAVCEEEGDTFPSYMSMLLFMQLTEKDVEALCAEANDNHERNREAFTKAAMHREAWLCEHMANAANAKSINGYMNLLKQEKNGGYIDKPGDKGKVDLNIKIDGVGGRSAFE